MDGLFEAETKPRQSNKEIHMKKLVLKLGLLTMMCGTALASISPVTPSTVYCCTAGSAKCCGPNGCGAGGGGCNSY
jgi:hypothetical protein